MMNLLFNLIPVHLRMEHCTMQLMMTHKLLSELLDFFYNTKWTIYNHSSNHCRWI